MSSIRLLVLGTIRRRGVTHGYGVHQDLTAWRAETWTNIKPGSIYHAMDKLAAQGMIRAEDPGDSVKRGPARTEYTLTPDGEAEFKTLLELALKSNEFQQMAAGIAFMETLSRKQVIALLEERLAAQKASAAFLRTLPTESQPSDPSKHPELVGMWAGYMEHAVTATRQLLQSLHDGKYTFADDVE
ncbi:PadR family transcriptional regulator [Cohnella hashimotonis]|uniref:PadR family transcriptional regulator n=1 Tax=Cohnella hashimotonis TaxID=2826895 RepID=A0ABT6TQP8_9BACL|nr:PadR family transcriptional regulator [Cohnella hashimotonis]MDI4649166.1 PadR family transcriptional regulator [Cohnella hashimotonis]